MHSIVHVALVAALLFGLALLVEFADALSSSFTPSHNNSPPSGTLLIHWKGEGIEGYSMQFRHLEFHGALSAVLGREVSIQESDLIFTNALEYSGDAEMPKVKLLRFNQAMQYLHLDTADGATIPRRAFVAATERCSLVHAIYEVVAEGGNYSELSKIALLNGGFGDMVHGQENEKATWCVRVRHYGEFSDTKKERRYGERARSLSMEKEALTAMKPLLETFGGGVNLREPNTKIYVFDGLGNGRKVLARRMASGPQVSTIAPTTRICKTNTPLCPIASFTLCNVAGVWPHCRILDPFAGSCAILLAAAMIEPSCQTVGIEIAHNGLVNRDDIRKDFRARSLPEPLALIKGDCSNELVRSEARDAINGRPFDFIISDPPYGIRESKLSAMPIEELFKSLAHDRELGTPLLRKGGKLVCFIPCQADKNFSDVMPTEEQMQEAGLICESVREQPLNDNLSRWLVSFVCNR